LGRVLRHARHVVAAGGYPAAEAVHAAGRELPMTIVPPGVDSTRFVPLNAQDRSQARRDFGFTDETELIVGISRLVPRKGFDTAIRAVATLKATRPNLVLAIAGSGRDRERLEKLARELDAPVRFLGRVAHDDLPRLYGCADIYTMLCRNRWGGLEQEGFGIVFVEAAACGIPQIAGSSGGAAEAVAHGETGFVVDESEDVEAVAGYMETLLDDPDLRRRMGVASRERAITEFSYEMLAERLGNVFGVWS
jgi:phosphatidylinositol alpha-1,6-mannosyltransferase